ncbi:hypothetical protein [Clostridium vincentii]|uniref:Uncharacterized protein n=1 Tax=Clostridium vincentii TaxID=52704 RepID=A0A2T0B8W4_9CLOT|nr:hypothetical protein [Clostridium vincentii]PRR80305.1 hypothetical protein CLVI_30950 [Clostridium vincentii]
MRGKIIATFSIILIIILAIMVLLMNNKEITNDKIPLIFIGVILILAIIFIGLIIKKK